MLLKVNVATKHRFIASYSDRRGYARYSAAVAGRLAWLAGWLL